MKGLTPSHFDAFKGALAGTFHVPSAASYGTWNVPATLVHSNLPVALKSIEWATNPTRPKMGDMSINHGCTYVGMAKQLLDCSNVFSHFQEVCGETVTQ